MIVTATGTRKQGVPATATKEMDTVVEVATVTMNAIVRGVVTVNATVVTPEDATGMSVAVKQQQIQRTVQQCQTTEEARKEYAKETVQFEHVGPEQARIRSRSRPDLLRSSLGSAHGASTGPSLAHMRSWDEQKSFLRPASWTMMSWTTKLRVMLDALMTHTSQR